MLIILTNREAQPTVSVIISLDLMMKKCIRTAAEVMET